MKVVFTADNIPIITEEISVSGNPEVVIQITSCMYVYRVISILVYLYTFDGSSPAQKRSISMSLFTGWHHGKGTL